MASIAKGTVNRAIVYSEPGTKKTHIEEYPIPEPGPGQILIRLLYSGVCHTDYAFCMKKFKLPVQVSAGQIGGHEGVGEVIEQGPGVTAPKIGSKVGIKYAADACLTCDSCLRGWETNCPSLKISGYFTPGTFQQYVVSPAKYVTLIPDGIDLAAAAPLMCSGVTVYAALKRASTKIGDWVLVSGGGGGLGHLAIQYAKAMGARVITVDSATKAKFCNNLGADIFIDFMKFSNDEELIAEVLKTSSGGVQTVLCCSSSQRSYDQAMNFLGFRGTLVCLGIPDGDHVPIAGAKVSLMASKEVVIFGQKAANRLEAKECVDIAARGLVKTQYQVRPMTELTKIFEEMEAGSIHGRVVLDLR